MKQRGISELGRRAAACLTLLTLTGAPSPHTTWAEELAPSHIGTIAQQHVSDGVYLAGQPQPDDFKDAGDRGVKTVVNLRLPGELKDFDEAKLVTDLGMQYENPGFQDPAALTDEIFDRVRALLNDPGKKPILLHCSSANRVGAVWLAHRVLDDGLRLDDALAEAKTVGLRVAAYEEKATDYIHRRQGKREAGPGGR